MCENLKGKCTPNDRTNHFNMVEIATNVIVFAGNARNLVMKALNAAYEEDFESAREFHGSGGK